MPTIMFTFATCGPGLLLYWEESWKYLYLLAAWLWDWSSKYRSLNKELQVWIVKRERKHITSLGNPWLVAAEEEKKYEWTDETASYSGVFTSSWGDDGWQHNQFFFKKSHKYGTQNANHSGKNDHLTCKPLLWRLALRASEGGAWVKLENLSGWTAHSRKGTSSESSSLYWG